MPGYFGSPREAVAWREMSTVGTPVGRTCHHCGEPIAIDDDGVVDNYDQVWHADCWLLKVLRKLNPDIGIPEVGRRSLREAASDAVRAFEREARL